MNATKYKFYIQSRFYICIFIKMIFGSLEVKLKYLDKRGILKPQALIENVQKYPFFRTEDMSIFDSHKVKYKANFIRELN
jgi:hypothetical protein